MIRVCFHGAESTGKSVLAERLAREMDLPWVPEYGRTFAEQNGTAFTMDDLFAIAEGQDAAMKAKAAENHPLLLLDTDPLMTAAWAQMLFGEVPDTLLAYEKAELYLLFEADTPFVEDGTRFFGSAPDRARFSALAEEMLQRSRVPYARIGGNWHEREAKVRAQLSRLNSPGTRT